MAYDYEGFKSAILRMTGIDLSAYKENQMKRRIDTLIRKHHIDGYEAFVNTIRSDRDLFEEFVNYLQLSLRLHHL